MAKYVVIIPYYGKFPSYFYEWALSASANDYIDFMIVSDIDFPPWSSKFPNIRFFYEPLQAVKKRADAILGFKTMLITPYKLCDFKPLYGLLFPDLISGYEWWGYGDIDVIYGDMKNFWPSSITSETKYLYGLGHLSLFRNEEGVKKLPLSVGRKTLKRLFSTRITYGFDEGPMALPKLLEKEGFTGEGDILDIHDLVVGTPFLKPAAHFNGYYRHLYVWKDGHLICNSVEEGRNEVHLEDCFYMHLQKRRIRNDALTPEKGFVIFPDRMVDYFPLDAETILENSVRPPQKKQNKAIVLFRRIYYSLRRRLRIFSDRLIRPFYH